MTPSEIPFDGENMFGVSANINPADLQEDLQGGYVATSATTLSFTVSVSSAQHVAELFLVTNAVFDSLLISVAGTQGQIDMVNMLLHCLIKTILFQRGTDIQLKYNVKTQKYHISEIQI